MAVLRPRSSLRTSASILADRARFSLALLIPSGRLAAFAFGLLDDCERQVPHWELCDRHGVAAFFPYRRLCSDA